MYNKAFVNHGDAHGVKDGDSIMVALSTVTTHGDPHPFDDYYPLETTWKAVPFRDRSLKFGRVNDGPKLKGYLAARQANRPNQSSMPTIKYVPAQKQARAAASNRAKPVRRSQKKINEGKKIHKGVKGVKTTFGSKNIKFMSVKQLEEALLKELKCTVLPMAMETPDKTSKKARIKHASQIRKVINQSVTKIITALDPYCLAHMASRGIYKDRNANAHLKTGLRHIVRQLLEYQKKKEETLDKFQDTQHPEPDLTKVCYGCRNEHYTHTCNRKRRIAHCNMAITTDPPDVETVTSIQSDHPQDEQDQAQNVVSPDSPVDPDGDASTNRSQERKEEDEILPDHTRSHQEKKEDDFEEPPISPFYQPKIHRSPLPKVKLEDDQEESVGSSTRRLQEAVARQERMLQHALAALEDLANERSFSTGVRTREPSQDRQQEDNSLRREREEPPPLTNLNLRDTEQNSHTTPDPRNSTIGTNLRWANSDSGSDPSSGGSSSSSSSTSSDDDITIPSVSDNNNPGRYYDELRQSARKLRRQQKKLKKRKRRQKHSADTIFRYLMKAADSYQLPVLNYDQSPIRRRGKFGHFLDKLKLVTSGVRETRKILTDTTTPKRPSKEASKALFRVLCARVDSYLRNQLQETAHLDGIEDGYAALMHLRSLFADQEDEDYKLRVETDFRTITLRNNEPIFDFNKRFGILYRNMVGANVRMSEKERIGIYLRALRQHKDPTILYDVKNLMRDLEAEHYIPLTDMQRLLVREDDRNSGYSQSDTRTYRQRHQGKRRSSHANAAQASYPKTKYPPKQNFPYSCYGCQQIGHMLKDCRTTSEADKKRIYDMMEKSKSSPAMPKPGSAFTKPKSSSSIKPSSKYRASSPYPSLVAKKSTSGHTSSKPKTSFSPGTKSSPPVTKPPKLSYAAAAIREPKRKISHANAAAATVRQRRIVYCGQAVAISHPVEQPIKDELLKDIPALYDDQVIENPKAEIVIYEQQVLLDSGASDCMCPALRYLTFIRNAFAAVCLADGTLHDVDYQGLMRISATDTETGSRTTIPMPDTLLVPGLNKILWSVSALTANGHQVIFGLSTVRIVLHEGTEDAITIHLNRPILTDNGSIKPALHALTTVREDPQNDNDEATNHDEDDSSTAPFRNNSSPTTISDKENLSEVLSRSYDPLPTTQPIPETLDANHVDDDSSVSTDDEMPALASRCDSSSEDEEEFINYYGVNVGDMPLEEFHAIEEHRHHQWVMRHDHDSDNSSTTTCSTKRSEGSVALHDEDVYSTPMFPPSAHSNRSTSDDENPTSIALPDLISRPHESSSDSDQEPHEEDETDPQWQEETKIDQERFRTLQPRLRKVTYPDSDNEDPYEDEERREAILHEDYLATAEYLQDDDYSLFDGYTEDDTDDEQEHDPTTPAITTQDALQGQEYDQIDENQEESDKEGGEEERYATANNPSTTHTNSQNPLPHLIPQDSLPHSSRDTFTVAPAFQVIPARPPRPIPPSLLDPSPRSYTDLKNITNKITTIEDSLRLQKYVNALGRYMTLLKEFQIQNRRSREPIVYDPAHYPKVQHAFQIPQRAPKQELTEDEHEQMEEAIKAFLLWNSQDANYTHWLVSVADRKGIRVSKEANAAATVPAEPQEITQPEMERTRASKPKTSISYELMHRRLGHRSAKSIFAAENAQLYSDVKIRPEHDGFCANCKISTIRSANRGPPNEEPKDTSKPGRVFYLDIQPNKAQQSLTSADFYKQYLGIVCDTTSFYRLMGMKGADSNYVIDAIKEFAVRYKPYDGYNLKDHCEEIHVDADSVLMSDNLQRFCNSMNIKLIAAAPDHQSTNGKPEVMWQVARKMAFALCNNARLGWPFFHHALMYAVRIMEVLPKQGCEVMKDGEMVQTCPKAMWEQVEQVSVSKYRVFGCPIIAKIYTRRATSSAQLHDPKAPRTVLNSKNIIQRGVRGIFLGLPTRQAGWLVYVPQSGRVLASADVAFDEDFDSVGLAYDRMLFYDSMPVRGAGRGYIDNSRQYAYTGPPKCVDFSTDDSDQDLYQETKIYEDQVTMLDTFELVDDFQDSDNGSSEEEANESSSSSSDEDDIMLDLRQNSEEWDLPPLRPSKHDPEEFSLAWDSDYTPVGTGFFDVEVPSTPKRRSKRIREVREANEAEVQDGKRRAYSAHAVKVVESLLRDSNDVPHDVSDYMKSALTEVEVDAPGSDPTPFQQIPNSIKDVNGMAPEVARAWIKSFVKEVKGILVERQACEKAEPEPEDTIVPVMDVYRCKYDLHGLLDKLKTRIVFRGDLYDPKEPLDTWNPHASFLALKLFLAACAKRGIFPCQVDYKLAYLQSDMRERVFVQFPSFWRHYLPADLHEWIGRPLLLRKALYGYNYSGKFLYLDQAQFLEENNFEQIMPGLWLKQLQGDKVIMFLHYVDDILVASDDEESLKVFLAQLTTRFEAEAKPVADWYLQTRLSQDKHGNITLDQTRYAKGLVRRFLPNFPEEVSNSDLKKYASPMKRETKLSQEDNSKSKEEVKALEDEYGFKYLELIGCFNWLSYTCYEELYAIRKLCRFMNLPGRPHFQAAIHLLHHFRCHPPRPLIFYHDIESAPVTIRILNRLEGFRDQYDPTFVVFADSSHADADKGKSTACHLLVVQGGLIEHTSWVPNPVPLSTAESESNCYSVAIMKILSTMKAFAPLFMGNPNDTLTVPILVDSNAAIAMNTSDQPTRRTRHVESRFWFGKQAIQEGKAAFVKVDGKTQQAADPGTKNQQAPEYEHYMDLFEATRHS